MIDEYRNLTMEGMDLIPLESNLYKFHLVVISQIINMIELDNFWHCRMFESVMSDLWNMWMEGIQKLENSRMDCTDNDENKKNSKEDDHSNMDEKKEEMQADLLKTKTTRYHHDIPKKERKMRKLWSHRKWSCYTLRKTSS